MRAINISNEQKRDSKVGFEPKPKRSVVKLVLPDGRDRKNVQFFKTAHNINTLIKKYGDTEKIKNALISGDPEIDIENSSRLINSTQRIYLTAKNEIAYSVSQIQIMYDASDKEIERRELSKSPSNIATEIPIKWTGKEFSKEEAVRKFVFSKKYQLRHTSGLTFDFLFNMASYLHKRNTMMFVGAGTKGNEPIILTAGGEPYRGFLEGRIATHSYCLILHLSSMEIKTI